MNKDELVSIIQKELKDNPKVTSLEIAVKHKIPVNIVDIFRRRIIAGQMNKN